MANVLAGDLSATKPGAEAQPAGAGTTKRKQQASLSSETGGHHHARAPKRKKASAREDVDDDGDGTLKNDKGDSLFKEGEMLKLRAEYWEAALLWEHKLVPGALDRWVERKLTQEPAAVDTTKTKKKKVVRIIAPNAYIDYIIENPDVMKELSDEEMAKCPKAYRQSYAIAKIINAKNHAYQQALIAQYRAFGFAYDEKEVTDDEEEEEEEKAVVVKN